MLEVRFLPSELMQRLEAHAYELGYRVLPNGDVIGLRGRVLKGWIDKYGYRYFRVGKKTGDVAVHRLIAYQKFGSKLYEPGLQVRHLNNDQLCNTPENIDIGTATQNAYDKTPETRLRAARTAAKVQRKITSEEAEEIRRLHNSGVSYRQLTERFGIAKSTVSYIVNNKTYKEV